MSDSEQSLQKTKTVRLYLEVHQKLLPIVLRRAVELGKRYTLQDLVNQILLDYIEREEQSQEPQS